MSTLPNTPLEQTPGTALAGHSSTAKPLGPHVESELAGETRKIYDRIARTYAIRWAEIPDGLLPFMELLVRHSEQDGLVLDVGCGHGRDLAWFERHGTRVLGLDLSVGMLSEARRLTGASLIQADMRSLPVRSSTMAAIWCCAALLHLPKREAPTAISEFQRVLRPGGLLFLGVQQGIHDAPRYSQSVVRHFADYLPHEMEDHLRRVGLTLVDQSTTVTGSVSWLQTVARKAA